MGVPGCCVDCRGACCGLLRASWPWQVLLRVWTRDQCGRFSALPSATGWLAASGTPVVNIVTQPASPSGRRVARFWFVAVLDGASNARCVAVWVYLHGGRGVADQAVVAACSGGMHWCLPGISTRRGCALWLRALDCIPPLICSCHLVLPHHLALPSHLVPQLCGHSVHGNVRGHAGGCSGSPRRVPRPVCPGPRGVSCRLHGCVHRHRVRVRAWCPQVALPVHMQNHRHSPPMRHPLSVSSSCCAIGLCLPLWLCWWNQPWTPAPPPQA
jgi:hypothetical protein